MHLAPLFTPKKFIWDAPFRVLDLPDVVQLILTREGRLISIADALTAQPRYPLRSVTLWLRLPIKRSMLDGL